MDTNIRVKVKPADGKIWIGKKLITVSEPEDFLAVLEEIVNTGNVIPHGAESIAFCIAMADESYLTCEKTFNGISFTPVYIDHLRDILINHLKELIFIKQIKNVTDNTQKVGQE